MSAAPEDEIAHLGYILGEMLTFSLFPKGNGAGWTDARKPYRHEHNALCWLAANKERIPVMGAWIHGVLEKGYPFAPFTHWLHPGQTLPAGAWWNASMAPHLEDD
ncbi:hypothetical protein HOU02_gp055 [Caulobacter phage CcrBL9]|uniref:Uncharacterized protein n=1 Tax=Caulobacter phage CcrBL9 TaxID=2283270 RepID=A0A385EEE1_9CAUD|nr:hypothetical protein HOU02_gp055 [Caulobacter phage CcrBL9]AXQ69079.1 hypothetical protein CcrBL9_gp055c [Caulobacter phage CcrBL9]